MPKKSNKKQTESQKTLKKNAIDTAIASLEKEYGKGVIGKFGARPVERVSAISTGTISVDSAIGVGGVPRGRIVEIFGPEGSGKCLTRDTYILSEDGYKTIDELFNENDIVPSCTNKTVKRQKKLLNMNGDLESTEAFTCNNRKSVFSIETESGYKIRSTANHPHFVINNRGHLVWKETKNITDEDCLVFSNFEHFGKKQRDKDEMYALGVLVADAHFAEKRISVTNDDQDIVDFIEEKIGHVIGHKEYKKYPNNDKGSFEYHFNCKNSIESFYKKYGYEPCVASGKYVSKFIREANKNSLVEFLRGFFDCESSIDSKAIEVSSASEKLLHEIKLILSQFGIVSFVSEKTVKDYPESKYWRLCLFGEFANKYFSEIGTRSSKIFNKFKTNGWVDKALGTHTTNTNSIPNLEFILRDIYDSMESNRETNRLFCDYMEGSKKSNLTYPKLKSILKHIELIPHKNNYLYEYLKDLFEKRYFFDKVKMCECGLKEPTFDFAMKKTHSFIANGFITHNTTLALGIIAEAQKAGGKAVFIDVEHALDPSHAKGIGVNMDELYISQPDSGEQALTLVEKLAGCGDVDVIIVDSVAALTPRAELEGDIGDSHVGLQARLMGQAMRKITPILSDKTSLVFINQIREKVGVMFGNPETTPGGRALKFYSSVRIDIRRIAKMKDGDAQVGNRVKIKVIKNKVAPPFKEAEIDLIFGRGFSKINNILDISVENNFIEKSGAWFSYNGDNIGQGKEAARLWLEENSDVVDELDHKCRIAVGLIEEKDGGKKEDNESEAKKTEEKITIGA